MSKNLSNGYILGLGNPLLDVSANVTEDFLKKYDLKPNNAILAEEKHHNLCKDMADHFKVDYFAGGAAQNAIRVAQWFFVQPQRTTFFGGIGKDQFGDQMQKKAKEDHVNVSYYIDAKVPTGTCACLITGKNRSLCAYLGASQKFNLQHLKDNIHLVNQASIFYTTGFHSMVCVEAQILLAEHAHSSKGKIFTMNLSAPYIPGACVNEFNRLLPYVDLLFGNETEAQAFADVKGWKNCNVASIAQRLADLEHKRPRTVVITQGSEDILVAFTNRPSDFRRFKVRALKAEEIVDTNGAGDSFVGGFLAYKALGKSLDECIDAGIYAAHQIIRMSGCAFPPENSKRLEGVILGLGSPLLDMIANVPVDFLHRYELLPNNVIRPDERHHSLRAEMCNRFQVEYIAGGAVQNTIRVAQWFCKQPKRMAFLGAIGIDEYGVTMRSKAEQDQIIVKYVVHDDQPTGTCACLITDQGKNRSLCAFLDSSQIFSIKNLHDNMDLIQRSKIIYTSGFFITVCFDAQMLLAKHVHDSVDKLFTFNLSANFISQKFSNDLNKIMPYVDILFGNKEEALAFAEANKWMINDIEKIVQRLADITFIRSRIVIITQGDNDILVAFTEKPEKFCRYPVTNLAEKCIIDTNGAGDSFVGGFLAYYAMGQPLSSCIEAGIYAATEVIQMSGCTFPTINTMRL
ncbi:hypothetical protein RDWZM_008603 [Blomia tropicalis]|uniref:Adenosine kinase n=1 Tax=Blomia tropicalis TaxID=40697 RepID=A0A9Q0RK88_BLOTA|nr:hypothetical protein RDWZM_008603 [Blomia tropicalis]